jgi:hypothetical protein
MRVREDACEMMRVRDNACMVHGACVCVPRTVNDGVCVHGAFSVCVYTRSSGTAFCGTVLSVKQ